MRHTTLGGGGPGASSRSRRVGRGLLVSGVASCLLVLGGMGLANATVVDSGSNGMSVTVVGAHLVNKVAVNVSFVATCSTANDEAADVGTPDGPGSEFYSLGLNFTLVENVKGTLVSYQGGTFGFGPPTPITCDGTPQAFTVTVLPQNCSQNGCTFGTPYKAGPAYIANGNAGAFDSDSSCGTNTFGNQTFPNPCDNTNFAGGVQISG